MLLGETQKKEKKEKRKRDKKIFCSEIQDYHFHTNWQWLQPPFVESEGPLRHQQFVPTDQCLLVPLLALDLSLIYEKPQDQSFNH
jgi:hypothetical protein